MPDLFADFREIGVSRRVPCGRQQASQRERTGHPNGWRHDCTPFESVKLLRHRTRWRADDTSGKRGRGAAAVKRGSSGCRRDGRRHDCDVGRGACSEDRRVRRERSGTRPRAMRTRHTGRRLGESTVPGALAQTGSGSARAGTPPAARRRAAAREAVRRRRGTEATCAITSRPCCRGGNCSAFSRCARARSSPSDSARIAAVSAPRRPGAAGVCPVWLPAARAFQLAARLRAAPGVAYFHRSVANLHTQPALRRGAQELGNPGRLAARIRLHRTVLAEGVRFELTVPLPARRISSPVH